MWIPNNPLSLYRRFQSLKSGPARQVEPVQAARPTRSRLREDSGYTGEHGPRPAPRRRLRPRTGERRRGERRQRNLPVLVDMRSPHDRRTRMRRAEDRRLGAASSPRVVAGRMGRGIDVEV